MSITLSKLQRNHRGLSFEFVGDGATTVLPTIPPAQLSTPIRGNTVASVTCYSAPSGKYESDASGKTGLLTQHGGTQQVATVAVSPSSGVTVTVSPAVLNGVAANCEVVFSNA
jgi:hypothetical protein